MHLVTRAKHAAIPLALGLLLPSRSVWAGPGTLDLGPSPLPFNQGVLTTEIGPTGLQFTPGIYRATTGRVLGGVVIETGNIRNLCFVTDAPSMGTLAAGILNEQPITGTTLYCAGADVKCGGWYYECAQTIATCFALTDAVIAVQDQAYGEYPLPAPPLWAGAVGSCELNPDPDLYHCLLSLNVVTQDNSFVSVMGGVQFNYAIPAPLVVPPQTYTDGPIAGVLLMTATQAISIYAGVVDVTNLPGAYVGHVAFNDGVDITTTAGVVHKSLIFYPPFSLMDFGMCTAGNISFNNNWCWDIAGVAMGWPVPGLQCPGAQVIPGGAIDAGRRPVIIPPKLQNAKAPKLAAGEYSVYGGPGSLLGKFEDVNHVFPQQQGWTHVDWTDGSGKPYTGDFAKLFTQFSELDPCHEDNSPLFGFIDDGTVPSNPSYGGPGTGGSTSYQWNYGVNGGWTVNATGGVSGGATNLHNAILSPEIAWDLPGTPDDGADWVGARLNFDVWAHLPPENGIHFYWSVRSHTASGWQGWRDRGLSYYDPMPHFLNFEADLAGLLPAGVDKLQIALGVIDQSEQFQTPLGSLYGVTPAPLFDNVSLTKFRVAGPVIRLESADRWQDAFPQSGLISSGQPAQLAVRLDAARMTQSFEESGNTAGDSMVVQVRSLIAGSPLLAPPQLYWYLEPNPVFNAARVLPAGAVALGSGWSGVLDGVAVSSDLMGPSEESFAFDLPDGPTTLASYQSAEPAFFFPGDRLRWYIRAEDTQGRVSTLPQDISGWQDGVRWPLDFEVRALPSLDGLGDQPNILFWYDGPQGETEYEILLSMLAQLGWQVGVHVDLYLTRAPGEHVGNGLGASYRSGATLAQLAGYEVLLIDQGALFNPLGVGSDLPAGRGPWRDRSDDNGLIVDWFNLLGNRYAAFFGDEFVHGLWASGGGLQALAGASLQNPDVKGLIGNSISTLVQPSTAPFTTQFVARGGCPSWRRFNAIAAANGALVTHQFTSDQGAPLYTAGLSRSWTQGSDQKLIHTFPIGLSAIHDVPSKATAGSSARVRLVEECVASFGYGSGIPTESEAPALRFAVDPNRPNPFNPATEIRITAPRRGQLSVRIFDLRGRLVRTLLDEEVVAGELRVKWLGDDADGRQVSSGVYFYVVEGFGERAVHKMALVQ